MIHHVCHSNRLRFFASITFAVSGALACGSPDASSDPVAVTFDTGEADAVLGILDGAREETDWQRLFTSAGYRRLKAREASMQRPFSDEAFRAFVLSDTLARRADALRATLTRWKTANVAAAAERALAYLPAGASLQATIYPAIKPWTNSFVYDLDHDPAIFIYVDPDVTPAQLENTLAHELHHIGFAGACPDLPAAEEQRARALRWLGAFGEGVAMLAAAGGPDAHPHRTSPPDERARWDRDVDRVGADIAELESFFTLILDGELADDEELDRARAYYGIQGPWYTVGWHMARLVETTFGRAELVAVLCDGPALLRRYNDAARRDLDRSGPVHATWSATFLDRLDPPM